MKKNDFIIMLICLAFIFMSQVFAPNKAFSQVDGVWFRTVIKVEDAKGNIDSVIFYVKEGATKGIDSHLGEVNLYGTEPQGDLDIRIVQRTPIYLLDIGDYWLLDTSESYDMPMSFFNAGSPENIDLKVDYRFDNTINHYNSSCPYSFVIKINAKHYPVSVFLTEIKGYIIYVSFYLGVAQFKEEDESYIKGSNIDNFISFLPTEPIIPYFLCTLNDASENNLIWIMQQLNVSIEEIINQPLLYPNPSKEYIVIEDGKYGEKFDITNLEGKLIQSFFVETYPYRLDIPRLPVGSYILKNAEGTIINKFIKE